jgi:CRP-like cAMP-binding protein
MPVAPKPPAHDSAETLLAAAAPFSALPAAALSALAHSPKVLLVRDEILFSAGDPAEAVYVVLSGEIALEIDGADGKSICVSSQGPGGVFGELAVLDGEPRSVGARATVRSSLISIKASTFLALVRAHPDFAMAIIRDFAGKVRRTNSQVSGLSFQSLRGRVAGLISSLLESQPEARPLLVMTQGELAGRLGASREKVNGHLQALQAAGAIRLGRGRIEVLDRRILARFAVGPRL